MLEAADYPGPEMLLIELFPSIITEPKQEPHANSARDPLPSIGPPAHNHLVGREAEVDQILNALRESKTSLLGIDGQGGIGKTAVGREVMRRCEELHLFDHTIWIQSGSRAGATGKASNQTMSFDNILNAIGKSVGASDFVSLSTADKQERIRSILSYHRVLVVLDNMETAAEPQEKIIGRLQPLLGHSKALLTSRRRFPGWVHSIHLLGLPFSDAIAFLKEDALRKGKHEVEGTTAQELEPVASKTGGSPLAIQLIVGQMGYLPIKIIMQRLQQVTSPTVPKDKKMEGEKSEYVRFYQYIFGDSWKLLTKEQQRLLVRLARFNTADGCNFDALYHVSSLDESSLIFSIESLWKISLLEANTHRFGEPRYYLHPLTQYFVLSDIVGVLA